MSKKTRTPMTPQQRKAAERDRRRAAGFVMKQVWVRPEHWDRASAYLRRLAATP